MKRRYRFLMLLILAFTSGIFGKEAGYPEMNKNISALLESNNNLRENKIPAPYAEAVNINYSKASITFCKSIDEENGIAISPSNHWNNFSNTPTLSVLVKNEKALKTSKVYINVFEGKDYSNFVSSDEIEVMPIWYYMSFYYKFDRPGKFKFDVLNDKHVRIITGYMEMSNKK